MTTVPKQLINDSIPSLNLAASNTVRINTLIKDKDFEFEILEKEPPFPRILAGTGACCNCCNAV